MLALLQGVALRVRECRLGQTRNDQAIDRRSRYDLRYALGISEFFSYGFFTPSLS